MAGETDSNGSPAAYRPIYSLFYYDSMNRLSNSELDAGMGIDDRRWSEKDIRYDFDGNILHIDRYQDNNDDVDTTLVFSYIGPHRTGYGYDANGNVSFDPLRGFDLKYNILNLPSEVRKHIYSESDMNQGSTYQSGNAEAGLLLSRSIYYADGTRAEVYCPADSSTVRYIGSMIFESTPAGESLTGILTSNGYIDCSGGPDNSEMQYFLRDHLGSVRVVAKDRNTVISRRDYLPSGVQMTGNGLTTDYSNGSSWYGFSGKENGRDGSRYLHFGARTYDPVGCIFLQLDPLTEKYYDITPYSYCAGNPVMFVDPDGKDFRRKYRGNTIYISATYYTNSDSEQSAKQAISFWNGRKGDTYIDEAGVKYQIEYSLTLVNNEIDMTKDEVKGQYYHKNTYSVNDDLLIKKTSAGETENDKHIAIRESYSLTKPGTSDESTTGAHEVGHSLGMDHKDTGIMTRAQDDSRTRDVPQSNINEMIESESGKNDILSLFVRLFNRIKN